MELLVRKEIVNVRDKFEMDCESCVSPIGIAGLARQFRIMDDDGNGRLSFDEFDVGMRQNGLCYLRPQAVRRLFNYFGRSACFQSPYEVLFLT